MFLAIFVLLMVAGSWTAWRRNPMYSTRSTVRGIIERLQARGLVELQSSPDDRRKSIVELTGRGHALLEQTTPTAARISELTMSDLNAVERVAVLHLLRKLCGPDGE